jgi:putative glutamine amidotransferase
MYRRPVNGAREMDRPRDVLEKRLLLEALAADLPILAICRGSQLMNIAHANGTLYQDISGHRRDDGPHPVRVTPDTKLAAILGALEVQVNSRHHQAVCDVGERLIVSARAHDGVVEALERADLRFAVAVQWHPEDLFETSEPHRRLFHAFAEALLPSAVRL